jgi:hypothetical protein
MKQMSISGVASFLSIFLIAWNSCCAATEYYFAASGNDGSACTSPNSPCHSIEKVNSIRYAAGDSILFRGGDKFLGCLTFNSTHVQGRGSPSNLITVDSYGDGKATLLSNCPGQRALVTIDGISGVKVQNLILSANRTQTAMGILIQNGIARNVLDTVIIQNNDIGGFNTPVSNFGSEVFVSGFANDGNCGALKNIMVVDNKLHGVDGPMSPDDNGITGYGCRQNITNVRYSGNEVYNIGGHGGAPAGTSGNGILVAEVHGGEASSNLVHDNGANTTTCGGPAGVWAYRSSDVTISFNEVYHMRPLPSYPGKGCDWDAFDLDVGVTNSVVEYNYSHDNAGPALLGYTTETWGPNSFRYNISENDQQMMVGGSGSISITSGGISYVYNNTIYRSGTYPGTVPPSCMFFGYSGRFEKGTLIANNLCVNSASDQFGQTAYLDSSKVPDVSAITLVNNLYYNPRGYNRWKWLDVEYSSLEAFHAATNADENSIVGNPSLTNAGFGGTCSWTPSAKGPQPCPLAYQSKSGSVAIGAGANLTLRPYNLLVGTRDYYGHAISHRVAGYNIGADGFAR